MLRSTYHVFDLYVNYLGDVVLDTWNEDVPLMQVNHKEGHKVEVDAVDIVCTKWSDRPGLAVAAVNKEAEAEQTITLSCDGVAGQAKMYTVSGNSTESYNDVDHEEVRIEEFDLGTYENGMQITLRPHSVNVIQIV